MNKDRKQKCKRVGIALAAVALSAVLCCGFVACGPTGNYLKEELVQTQTGETLWEAANSNFKKDYATMEEVRAAGSKLNTQLAEEGMVLLKNDNKALPLASGGKLSLFGYRSYSLMTGGGGSGAGKPGSYGIPTATLTGSLTDAGFEVNDALQSIYDGKSEEVSIDELSGAESSYTSFGDAAIVTIARGGSEGSDLKTHDAPGNADTSKHVLELNDAEIELVKYVKSKFDKVIVFINSANVFEMGELNAEKTEDNLGVDAILWIGQVGNDGATAIGRILNGTVDPSGHTVDTWERDFTKGPTYTNIGDLSQNFNADGSRSNNNLYVNGSVAYGADGETYHSVEYREGIYVGYRYYETMADEMNAEKEGSGDAWFDESVVYPFGYGLSYTSFRWEIAEDIAPEATIDAANSTITIKAIVTNTGDVAGKDVVQVYVNPPYTEGGIEKATANLMGFAKTSLLEPGQSETVEVKFVAQDMASFDWNDANGNDFIGYELEAGDYVISARYDSHNEAFSVVRTVEEDILCKTDYYTGNEIASQFTGQEGLEMYKSTNDALEENLISRTDLKQPAASTIEDRTVSSAYISGLNAGREYFSYQDSAADPWYVSAVPSEWDQAASRAEGELCDIMLEDMIGVSYTEPTIENGVATAAQDADSQKWEEFMNQLTWGELVYLISAGDYGQGIPIPAIGKEVVYGGDGPTQFAWNSGLFFGNSAAAIKDMEVIGTNWVIAPIVAATWNTELAAEQGNIIGNESLVGGKVNEWYGPGCNIHRSPFSGRNFEYYSEDGVLSGEICSEVTRAASAKGVMVRLKHMFLNDQETNRNTSGGVLTWCNEQAIREIYLKPYEMCVKYGQVTGGMTAFNRIGDAVCSTNYALLENIFRGEWNFRGTFVTDCQDYPEYRYLNLTARTGQELPLGQTINLYKGEKIFVARFGVGYASAVEGTWSPADKCVKVSANAADAEACEALRKGAGDMYNLYNDAALLAQLAEKEIVLSPTHYYAVRKSAQRVLYDYVNSNNMMN